MNDRISVNEAGRLGGKAKAARRTPEARSAEMRRVAQMQAAKMTPEARRMRSQRAVEAKRAKRAELNKKAA